MKKTLPRIAIVLAVLAAVLAYFQFDLGSYLTLDYLKSRQTAFQAYYQSHPALAIGGFLLIYILVTGTSIPGAAMLSLIAGGLFGLTVGTIVVSFGSTIGATLAFLVSRFMLRDLIQHRFTDRLQKLDRELEKDGAFYLFSLRLVPLFPFWLINLLMGVTPIRTWSFIWVSQVGMLPGTIVYVNAGTQLGQLESAAGILSPSLIGSFVLLGLFPLAARKLLVRLKNRPALHRSA